ncbi:hypothetical protein [Mycobacterium marinum]|uniref:hypothetical protein n=1 Tax=Mycobacterium marinum TaxID=1781 RepID=UPI001FB63932|nr:hypothetical protein [Mycobacterium marinum]
MCPAGAALGRLGEGVGQGLLAAIPSAMQGFGLVSPLNQARALVIGAGVSGWTTALVLVRRGWRVVVVADRLGIDTVSTVAGVLWEWPSSVGEAGLAGCCGCRPSRHRHGLDGGRCVVGVAVVGR